MATACIETPHARVSLHSDRLIVQGPPDSPGGAPVALGEIRLLDLEALQLMEQVQITSQALGALLRRGVPVRIMDYHGRPLGDCLPGPVRQAAVRLRQYERTTSPPFCLAVARQLVAGKIFNQRRVLQRLAESGGEKAGASGREQVNASLAARQEAVSRSAGREELLGLEGASTACYLRNWATALPEEFPFERRSTRPPQNAVNACLSYIAAIVYHEFVARLHAHGLDPGLGVFHVPEDSRWSLALDLMEPFRPPLVEGLTLRLFNLRILKANDFEARDGGIFLNTSGRREVFVQHERQLHREFLSEFAGHRTTLRQQMDDQVVRFKQALNHPEQLQPFRLN